MGDISTCTAGRTVAIYVVVATLWILLTDTALQWLGLTPQQVTELEIEGAASSWR